MQAGMMCVYHNGPRRHREAGQISRRRHKQPDPALPVVAACVADTTIFVVRACVLYRAHVFAEAAVCFYYFHHLKNSAYNVDRCY